MTERRLPPVTGVAITSMALIVIGGIWIASHLPHHVPLGPAVALLVASYVVVGVMAVIALGLLEPANVAVLFELKKPRPDPTVIQRLMKRFIYTAGITGAMQVATLVIMTKVATG